MARKKKQKTSIAGFDSLDAVVKPKQPKRIAPASRVKRHKSPKRPR